MYNIRVAYGQFEVTVSSPVAEWTEAQAKIAIDCIPEMVEAEYERAGLPTEEVEDGDGDGEDGE